MNRLICLLAATLVLPTAPAAASELQSWDGRRTHTFDALKAPVRIVNLWATWCAPCRKEMPEMSAWYRQQKKGSVDMVGIAFDSSEQISRFLKQTPVAYPVWRYAGTSSRSYMKTLGNQVGVLPFTLIEMPKCGYRQAITGEVNAVVLTQAVAAAKAKCR